MNPNFQQHPPPPSPPTAANAAARPAHWAEAPKAGLKAAHCAVLIFFRRGGVAEGVLEVFWGCFGDVWGCSGGFEGFDSGFGVWDSGLPVASGVGLGLEGLTGPWGVLGHKGFSRSGGLGFWGLKA